MTVFFAQPYSTDHTGFYFESTEQFEAGMEALNNKGCEEVEIQFIDGDASHAQLAQSVSIGQGDIDLWFDELEELDEQDTTRLCYLLDQGYNLDSALPKYEDVCLHYDTAKDYAQELIEETTEIPENLQCYIDYEAIARDMEINGEIVEIKRSLIVTNAHEF